ncbi:TrkA family potassium uptake protein [Epidermidibacterium keratini]|uniref:Trk system potassium uptake protein TrkA n=1 Tax=Epidermidibacterium keratini TaxID=1891644 RepID=A0A7L4YST2_9ACTN|nr:TrkA family potassium uptake protein [Epidermidibacterium keratini]QHC01964.1 TrkA family potassium uptake protein [Epidermidibacterium keratini]
MHIVIMGCGRVGSSLARRLDSLGHSVAVIDQNAEAFRRLGSDFRGDQVKGPGFDRETLVAAGIEKAEAFAAVSSGDNSNIISARVAREIFGVRRVVARIYDPKRAEVYERLGIPTVATVPWTADRLFSELMATQSEQVWRDPSGAIALARIAFDEAWVGRKLREFEEQTGLRAAFLNRFGQAVLPTESTVLQHGDALYALVAEERYTPCMDAAIRPPDSRS